MLRHSDMSCIEVGTVAKNFQPRLVTFHNFIKFTRDATGI